MGDGGANIMRLALGVGLTACSYLLGAIPFAFLIARAKGIDIRERGSGNIGATNIGRVLGKPYGYVTFFLDTLKGILPVLGAALLWDALGWDGRRSVMAACAGGAIAGHIWPVFLGFRGGKGVATTIGASAVLYWPAAAIGLTAWLFGAYVLRYVFVGSVLFALALPVSHLILLGEQAWGEEAAVTVLFTAIAVLVAIRHRSNFRRMLEGREDRTGEKSRETV